MKNKLSILNNGVAVKKGEKFRRAMKMKQLYLLLIPATVLLFIFAYIPMYGIIIAFKNFKAADGIFGSAWNNFKHFRQLFRNPGFARVFRNTISISLLRIIFGYPAPIIFALLLNELFHVRFKKIIQTISYLPYFMSWVVLSGILVELLSPTRGAVNYVITWLGGTPVNFLTSSGYFIAILIISGLWQGVGYGAIIYLASLSSINPELYESADLDGANRFRKAVHISIPSLVPVITILFILGLGGILNAGFDQIFNLYNPIVYDVADIIDTYLYRVGLQEMRYDFATAVGLFRNIIAIALIIGANIFARKFSEYALW